MADTSDNEIRQWLSDFVDDSCMELAVLASKIGEDALAISRGEHRYQTQTGNLQSSCGYAVTLNGTLFKQGAFESLPGMNKPDGDTGAEKGRAYLEECLRDKQDEGITLIMVAGMDYAGYVEDWGGDVLKSAEAHIRKEFDKISRGII